MGGSYLLQTVISPHAILSCVAFSLFISFKVHMKSKHGYLRTDTDSLFYDSDSELFLCICSRALLCIRALYVFFCLLSITHPLNEYINMHVSWLKLNTMTITGIIEQDLCCEKRALCLTLVDISVCLFQMLIIWDVTNLMHETIDRWLFSNTSLLNT